MEAIKNRWSNKSKGMYRICKSTIFLLGISLSLLGVLLSGCDSSSTSSGVAIPRPASNQDASSGQSNGSSGSTQSNAGGSSNADTQYRSQYLEKSLQVSLQVKTPTQSANDLQAWITQTDTQATSSGTNYQQVENNQYDVTLSFLVDVSHYDQIKAYLRDYAGQHGGKLVNLQESVKDVSDDYVDSQSTLTNLRAEQQRLLSFMSSSQKLSDTLAIEQQLTQVEGQINAIEAHLNALKGETSFYPVTITLNPLSDTVVSPPTSGGWSIVPVWQGAWSAVIAIWELLADLVIWLLALSVYLLPAGLVIWFGRRWLLARRVRPASGFAKATEAD